MADADENTTLQQLVTLLRNALRNNQSCDIGLQFENFKENEESWNIFIQRLENFFSIRGLTNETDEVMQKKRELLLHTMGTKTLQLLATLTSPDEPNTKTYNELVTLLQEHLQPKPSEIAEQNKFSKRVQQEGESIASFVTELKKLSKNCNFKCPHCDTTTIDVHLRQQFISGVRSSVLLERLIQLKPPHNTFKDCVDLAIAIESAQKESKEIQNHFTSIKQVRDKNYKENFLPPKQDKNTYFSKQNSSTRNNFCYRCGNSSHLANACKHIDSICSKCQKKGHLARVCCADKSKFHTGNNLKPKYQLNSTNMNKSNKYNRKEGIKNVEYVQTKSNFENHEKTANETLYMNSLRQSLPECSDRPRKIIITCQLDGQATNFEFDTGATVTSISEYEFKKILPNKEINKTELQLKTYTGEIIHPIGYATVNISYKNQENVGNIYILRGNVDAVFGREWMNKFQIDFPKLLPVSTQKIDIESEIQKLCSEFSTLFSSTNGKIPNYQGKLILKDNVKPVFRQPRQIPFAIKDRVLEEIDRLEEKGIFTKVTYSDWGTPLVPVVKRNGSVRLCADYKCTLNPNLKDDHFPIPNIEEIFATMKGGKYFTSLDLSQAYLSMEVDEASAMMQAVSTPKGVYKVNRLMFGTKVAPAIWQRFMSQLLEGIPGVSVFFDDIKVHGSTINEHMERLRAVFQKLLDANLRINKEKSQFCKSSIRYLGHIIDKNGLSKTPEKIEAVLKAPRPKNISELRSWLGLVNYYGKFFKNLSSKLHPLYKLLQKDVKFTWAKDQENAFQLIKDEITSDEVLVPYDPDLPILLSTDASPNGIGVVLSHVMPDNTERPIAYASRSLTPAEKNYSQIDKEATAIYWGVLRFFQYLYGRKFTLITDHKPLVSIFSPDKQLPILSAQRLLHYAQFLQGFDYTIKYRNTKEHSNADALSRLPLENQHPKEDDFCQLQLNPITDTPVTHAKIAKETAKDPILRDVYQRLTQGIPLKTPGFEHRDIEFSIEEGCILRGSRIVIPKILQQSILEELHLGHLGIVKMKALSRSYVWWYNIDKDIEKITKNCQACCMTRNMAAETTIHPWEYPSAPWQRVHVDFAGPYRNKMFLICVDAYSKWPEVVIMNSTTSEKTIEALYEIFSRYGLPITLVSDNGSQFTSSEFSNFTKRNGITHKLIPTYNPSSNGQAERYVATIKNGIRKIISEPGPLHLKLANFLLHYRKSPNATTGISPCELLMKRNLRTLIDLVRPNLTSKMQEKNYSPQSAKNFRQFEVGENVQARNYNNKDVKWKFGKIVRREGLMNYWISVDGQLWKRHVNQLLKCGENAPTEHEIPVIAIPATDPFTRESTSKPTTSNSENSDIPPVYTPDDTAPFTSGTSPSISLRTSPRRSAPLPSRSPIQLRRSARIRKPVVRMNL